jgi:hypothetical protein
MSVGRLTIVRSIQLKSSTVRPTSSGWRATCSASAFSFFSFASASSSPSMMTRSHFRGGGARVASTFASRRSMRKAGLAPWEISPLQVHLYAEPTPETLARARDKIYLSSWHKARDLRDALREGTAAMNYSPSIVTLGNRRFLS